MPGPATLSGERTAMQRYEHMVFIRSFEDKVDALYRQGQVRGPAHLGQGQEAIAVGTASVLRADDYSIGTYRGHAHALARGAPAEAVMRELLGRSGGICGGKGGSMHITSVEHGYMGSYAVVGAHLPIACGLAWASKIKGTGQVTACFFGDGTTNIGAFHEAVNLAAVWQLPVVFVCENNGYMEYTPISQMIPVAQPAADRAAAYGLEPVTIDGNDVEAVREVLGEAVATARSGGGTALVEALTYRHGGHSAADPAAYRSPDEVSSWKECDPLLRARATLLDEGVPACELDEVTARSRAAVQEIAEAALAAPVPEVATTLQGMWTDGSATWRN
jgi:TPP-dependent pyruvate/acetoin dehydrogenase alpha subunit